ncbi:MAG: PQQ-dependent sugar dehydrogenase [Pseudomonadota bacterium]
MLRRFAFSLTFTAALTAHAAAETFPIEGSEGTMLQGEAVASFDQPWAMTFMDETRALVTTKPGKLIVVNTSDGSTTEVTGLPKATVGGQGGMGDVVLHPDFAENSMIYLSFVESLDGGATRGAVVVRGKLVMEEGKPPAFTEMEPVWTQQPKLPGRGHFSHRIAFGPEGSPHEGMMFITSGDRQKQTPSQDWDKALGKVIRLNDDGSVPADNPWQEKGELAKTFWSTGHRNPLGIDFDASGRLWTNEMGPKHGDELNLIEAGSNYGWPVVSYGDNYNGVPIPDHDTRPEFNAPEAYWVPSIAPSGLVMYDGEIFADWKGDALIGGLVSQALIRVDVQEDGTAAEAERYAWNKRIREVEQGPEGAIWVLEDRDGGRLVKLTPAS